MGVGALSEDNVRKRSSARNETRKGGEKSVRVEAVRMEAVKMKAVRMLEGSEGSHTLLRSHCC